MKIILLFALIVFAGLILIYLVRQVMSWLKRDDIDDVDTSATIFILPTPPAQSPKRVFTGGLRANPELRSLWKDSTVVIDGNTYRVERTGIQYADAACTDVVLSYFFRVCPVD